ncbi:hypothetical protein M5689_023867 [Euphorbia peplus]|nr:hypothetical protein M5689_023867 [Euphorbia peplus]
MGNPFISLPFAVLVSFSLTSSSSSSSSRFFPKSPIPKATPADLLSILGPTTQSSKVNPLISQELGTCLKFLVPFVPIQPISLSPHSSFRRTLTSQRRQENENELIWWPPQPLLELARLAFDSGGDPDAIYRALDPTVLPIPDVEGSKEKRCELTRTPYGRRFISEELNSYLKFLFELIVARGPSVGLNVSLSRYDFFHGHVFIANGTGRLGILFHAKEYPAYDKKVFPYNMGYCQKGSNVTYDDSMNLRNILWLAPYPSDSSETWVAPGVLVVLDAHPGGIIYRDLIPEYVDFARTIYEEYFGEVVADVNYLKVGKTFPNYQIFLC